MIWAVGILCKLSGRYPYYIVRITDLQVFFYLLCIFFIIICSVITFILIRTIVFIIISLLILLFHFIKHNTQNRSTRVLQLVFYILCQTIFRFSRFHNHNSSVT